jgi:hypothetical protein
VAAAAVTVVGQDALGGSEGDGQGSRGAVREGEAEVGEGGEYRGGGAIGLRGLLWWLWGAIEHGYVGDFRGWLGWLLGRRKAGAANGFF